MNSYLIQGNLVIFINEIIKSAYLLVNTLHMSLNFIFNDIQINR